MEGVTSGIIFGLIIIAILEVCRCFRWIGRSEREIRELKKRVDVLEAIIKDQNE